jgi:hypothetical protein
LTALVLHRSDGVDGVAATVLYREKVAMKRVHLLEEDDGVGSFLDVRVREETESMKLVAEGSSSDDNLSLVGTAVREERLVTK